MAPQDREKIAFCTQEGLFEFSVMPFGTIDGLCISRDTVVK